MRRYLSRCDGLDLPPKATAQAEECARVLCLRDKQCGFTLIELMVTLVISAILLSVAVPAYQSFIGSTALTTATNDLVAALNMARSEALKRDGAVSLRGAGTITVDFAGGYCIVLGATPDSCDGAIRNFPAVGSDITVAASGIVTFDGLGGLSNASSVTRKVELCRAGEDYRRVTIALVGRSTVSADSSCPS